ncbi:MAG: FAD-dependent oxidoreductase [Planctomycetes bacterium]|nr:FAD-dependent oxidoreductase [Planctomycetota bacterium]
MNWLPGVLAWFLCLPLAAQVQVDVCVYGANAAGCIAAIDLAQRGRTVALLDADGHLGGLTTSGLGATDVGNKDAIGGLARAFYRRLRRHYDRDENWTRQRRSEFRGRGHEAGEDVAWTFEPSVAMATLRAMLDEAKVAVTVARLDRSPAGVGRDGARLSWLKTESGVTVTARVFLDCSYEGDLMAAAGCSYHVGREANAVYGETLNGVQTKNARFHQFAKAVDPYVVPGDSKSGLIFGVQAGGPGEEGAGDHKVQAFCYRLCATDVVDNRVPWPKPDGYDVRTYELLLRAFAAGDTLPLWHPVEMPNRKTDSNNHGSVSTDFLGANWRWPEGSYVERAAIAAAHRRWQQGLFWTLANEQRVPAKVRTEFSRWGLCQDEFVDSGHWPPLLYVREGRRLVGELVVTEHHCMGREVAADPVGMGAYAMDSHNVQRYVGPDGTVRNEGDVQVKVPQPYGISLRALLPKARECDNLLVPVAVSASHIAYGSIRMEPVFMVLAQSAAVVADLALAGDLAVQSVGYETVRDRLLAAGQVLTWPVRRK